MRLVDAHPENSFSASDFYSLQEDSLTSGEEHDDAHEYCHHPAPQHFVEAGIRRSLAALIPRYGVRD